MHTGKRLDGFMNRRNNKRRDRCCMNLRASAGGSCRSPKMLIASINRELWITIREKVCVRIRNNRKCFEKIWKAEIGVGNLYTYLVQTRRISRR